MAGDQPACRFFTRDPDDFPFKRDPDLICPTAHSINLLLSDKDFFTEGAIRFGQVRENSLLAQNTRKALEVIGDLVTAAQTYGPRRTVSVGGHIFPRVVAAFFGISNPDGKKVGWLLRVFWLEGSEAQEDADLEEMREDWRKSAIYKRRVARNPDERLKWMFSEVSACVWCRCPTHSLACTGFE